MKAILEILAFAAAITGGGSAWAIDEIYTGRFSSVELRRPLNRPALRHALRTETLFAPLPAAPAPERALSF